MKYSFNGKNFVFSIGLVRDIDDIYQQIKLVRDGCENTIGYSFNKVKELLLSDDSFFVVVRHNRQIAATSYVSLHDNDPLEKLGRSAHFGGDSVSHDYRGHKLQAEMIKYRLLLTELMFNIERFCMTVHPENIASAKSIVRAGFEKSNENPVYLYDSLRDVYVKNL